MGALVAGHPNPFVRTAIDQWEAMLRAGHRIWAVAGSDDKLGDGYGGAATVIGADRLGVAAVRSALVAGRAYVKARGVHASPDLALVARATAGGASGSEGDEAVAAGAPAVTFGGTVAADAAEITVTVRNARGQSLALRANGNEVATHTVTSDDWQHRFVAGRRDDEGPLGTFWIVETHDDLALTALANPLFVIGGADPGPAAHRPLRRRRSPRRTANP